MCATCELVIERDDLRTQRGPTFQSLAKYAAEIRDIRAQRDALVEALEGVNGKRPTIKAVMEDAMDALRKAGAVKTKTTVRYEERQAALPSP